MKTYFVYILASRPQGTLYIGVTNSIIDRIDQHRAGLGSKFTARYKVHTLVWFELHSDITAAIQREKSLKEWPRPGRSISSNATTPAGPTSIQRCRV